MDRAVVVAFCYDEVVSDDLHDHHGVGVVFDAEDVAYLDVAEVGVSSCRGSAEGRVAEKECKTGASEAAGEDAALPAVVVAVGPGSAFEVGGALCIHFAEDDRVLRIHAGGAELHRGCGAARCAGRGLRGDFHCAGIGLFAGLRRDLGGAGLFRCDLAGRADRCDRGSGALPGDLACVLYVEGFGAALLDGDGSLDVCRDRCRRVDGHSRGNRDQGDDDDEGNDADVPFVHFPGLHVRFSFLLRCARLKVQRFLF